MSNYTKEELEELLRRNKSLTPSDESRANSRGIDALAGSLLPSAPVKPSKYHAKKTIYNGVRYDSAKEADFAQTLDLRQRAGEITFWLRQIPFQLSETVYRLDFITFAVAQGYEPGAWDIHFYEVKGMETPLGELKRRQCQKLFGICIEVV